jgi:hypothetical protein
VRSSSSSSSSFESRRGRRPSVLRDRSAPREMHRRSDVRGIVSDKVSCGAECAAMSVCVACLAAPLRVHLHAKRHVRTGPVRAVRFVIADYRAVGCR